MAYQQRYIAYANAHGMTPDEMLDYDRARCPGGVMCEYIIWIGDKVRAFREINPSAFVGTNIQDHDAFTEYLFT